MDERRKASKNGPLWFEWKCIFLMLPVFVFPLEYAEKHGKSAEKLKPH